MSNYSMSNISSSQYARSMLIDPIEQLEAGWKRELPDLDTKAMATVARLNRTMGLLRSRIEQHMNANGSTLAEFDVLSTLRRAGPPHEMKPSAIARATMLSPSGMTHRIDQLEAAELIERVPDPTSRRTAPVALTEQGRGKAEDLARSLAEVEQQLLEALTDREQAQLDTLLTKVLDSLETEAR